MEKTAVLFILFGGFVSFLLACGQLATQRPRAVKFPTAALFFSIGMMQLGSGYYLSGLMKEYSVLILFDLPFQYFIGPLLIINYSIILKREKPFSKTLVLHFLPGILCLILFLIYSMKSHEEKILYLQPEMISHWLQYPWIMVNSLLCFFAVVSIAVYTIIFLFKNHLLWNRQSFKREPLVFHMFLVVCTTVVIFLTYICLHLLDLMGFIAIVNSLISLVICWVFILSQRFPEIFLTLQREAEKVKYERSHLKALNVEALVVKLEELMEREQVFTEEDLTLNTLAAKLSITRHQLSELLNDRLGKKYNDYINEFRIKYAKELLTAEPNRTVLSIAYEVGFSSESGFYSFFHRSTKTTPVKYRKKYFENPPQ